MDNITEGRRYLGSLPISAVTPEMRANPRLILESPLFRTAEEMEALGLVGEDDDMEDDDWEDE